MQLPTELVLQIASHLQKVRDLNALVRVSRSLASVLSPVLGRLATEAVDRRSRRPLLQWAAATGRTELLIHLLSHGADVNSGRKSGTTALHSSVLRAQRDAARILLEHGADREALNNDGWTPLHLAAITGNHDLVGLLLEHGADIEARSTTLLNKTALHYAGLRGHRRVVELLIVSGADVGAKDSARMTVAEKAAAAGHAEIVGLVLGTTDVREILLAAEKKLSSSPVRTENCFVRMYIDYRMWVEGSNLQFHCSGHM